MKEFFVLLDLACGKPLSVEDGARAHRVKLMVTAILSALVFSMLWGAAAGCKDLAHKYPNLWMVPIMVLVSALVATPAGLLAWKLSGADGRATDLLLAFAVGIFGGTLVLGVLSPLVAIYYWSSAWAGPVLGQAATGFALLLGALLFTRAIGKKTDGAKRRSRAIAAAVLLTIQGATLLQLIGLSPAIFPEHTVFDRGIDHLTDARGTR